MKRIIMLNPFSIRGSYLQENLQFFYDQLKTEPSNTFATQIVSAKDINLKEYAFGFAKKFNYKLPESYYSGWTSDPIDTSFLDEFSRQISLSRELTITHNKILVLVHFCKSEICTILQQFSWPFYTYTEGEVCYHVMDF